MGRVLVAMTISGLLIVVINFALFPIIGWWDLTIDAIPAGLTSWYLWYRLEHDDRGADW